jgi:hypothetical protein
VPIDDPQPPVLVGGELLDDTIWSASAGTVQYAPNVESFVAARRWDHACLAQEPLLQAQAAELGTESLDLLRGHFDERPSTVGWPGRVQYRFEGHSTKIMLWSGPGQCDWWISSGDVSALRKVAKQVLSVSDLRTSLWSTEPRGMAVLQELRDKR